MAEKETDPYYLAKARELANIMYDKRLIADDCSRETVQKFEEFIGFYIESMCSSAVMVDRLNKKVRQ